MRFSSWTDVDVTIARATRRNSDCVAAPRGGFAGVTVRGGAAATIFLGRPAVLLFVVRVVAMEPSV
ncbi:MAG: hypothetical protein ACKORK_13155 [Gemmatimonadota bacterium]